MFAVENMYPWRARGAGGRSRTAPAGTRSSSDYATRHPRPLAHGHRRLRRAGDGRELGDRLAHVHLADGVGIGQGRAPGARPRRPAVRRAAGAPRRQRLRRAWSCWRSTRASGQPGRSGSATWPSRWPSPGCISPRRRAVLRRRPRPVRSSELAARRRADGAPEQRARTPPGRGRTPAGRSCDRGAGRCSPTRGFDGTSMRAVARERRGRPGARAPLLRRQGRALSRRAGDTCRSTVRHPGRCSVPASTGSGSGWSGLVLSVWDDPRAASRTLPAYPLAPDERGRQPISSRAACSEWCSSRSPRGLGAPARRGVHRGRDAGRAADRCGTCWRSSRSRRCRPTQRGAAGRAEHPALPLRLNRVLTPPRASAKIHHMMNNRW